VWERREEEEREERGRRNKMTIANRSGDRLPLGTDEVSGGGYRHVHNFIGLRLGRV
jgi:hypothetical protein